MKCPSCGSEDAYIGIFDIDCPNENCRHFQGNPISSVPAAPVAPNTPPGSGPAIVTTPKLSVSITGKVIKRSSILLSVVADGDPGYPDKVIEFFWWIKGSNVKNVCTLSSRYRYYIAGVDANGSNVYKTHWRCTFDGVNPNDPWEIEARIS
jgi:hypothetical protein